MEELDELSRRVRELERRLDALGGQDRGNETLEAVVETNDLTKRFGDIEAVKGLDLRVWAGETYGLLGPNGSGKTTLIRMLVGLISPTAGVAKVFGKKMPDKEVLSHVGYMTQAEALYQELTVRENIRFFGRIYGEIPEERVEELLRLIELRERANAKVATLSSGMRRRISLACSLVHKPRLLLLDEPTVGIDPQLRATFWQHFKQLNQQGVAIILTSHAMDEAERCDRLGLMSNGRLVAEGSVAEVISRAGKSTLEEAFLYHSGGSHEMG